MIPFSLAYGWRHRRSIEVQGFEGVRHGISLYIMVEHPSTEGDINMAHHLMNTMCCIILLQKIAFGVLGRRFSSICTQRFYMILLYSAVWHDARLIVP